MVIIDMEKWRRIKIKELRQSLKLTQIAFAEIIGVTNIHICNLEKGKRRPSKTLCTTLDSLERKMKEEN
jgi:DNA-binding XRE family transcriptional regulator